MAKNRRGPATSPTAPYVLSVFSVGKGTVSVFRTLSDELSGLGTHYKERHPIYCHQDRCQPANHRLKYQWRGYIAGEVWTEKIGRWAPHVIEITEACELDMRHLYRRGQQWEVSREMPTDKYHPPVVAVLLAEDDPATYPQPFPILPTLARVYHEPVTLDVANWMPDRTLVTMSDAPGPRSFGTSSMAPVDNRKISEIMDANRKATGDPCRSPQSANGTNGHH